MSITINTGHQLIELGDAHSKDIIFATFTYWFKIKDFVILWNLKLDRIFIYLAVKQI